MKILAFIAALLLLPVTAIAQTQNVPTAGTLYKGPVMLVLCVNPSTGATAECATGSGGGGGNVTVVGPLGTGAPALGVTVTLDTTDAAALQSIITGVTGAIPAQSSHGVNIGGVEGLAAAGAALTGYPVLIAGSDGTDVRDIATDATGHPILGAGSSLIGKAGIDQTTPGTTNAVATQVSQGGSYVNQVGCGSHVYAHITSATDTLLVQGVTSQQVRACGVKFSFSGSAAQAAFLEDTASTNANCTSTKVQLAGQVTGSTTGPSSDGFYNPIWGGLQNGAVSRGTCINTTGSGAVDVDFWYTQF